MSTTPMPVPNQPDAPSEAMTPAVAAPTYSSPTGTTPPDFGNVLSQPGASVVAGQPAPNMQTGALNSAQEAEQQSIAANKKAGELAAAPLPATGYTGPHGRLL